MIVTMHSMGCPALADIQSREMYNGERWELEPIRLKFSSAVHLTRAFAVHGGGKIAT